MVTIPSSVLIIASAMAAAPAAPAECDAARAHVTAAAPTQGAVVLLQVDAEPAAGEPAATWKGEPLRFWRDDTAGPWRALVGIDLEQPPGPAVIRLERGPGGPCEIRMEVTAGTFAEDHLTLPRRFVDLSPADQARAAKEANRLAALFRAVTAERLWDGPFHLPIEDAPPSSSFGRRRILNGQRRSPHTGVDLSAPTGTPVHAMQRGRVVLVSDLFFSGHTIVLDHGLGLFSLYGHLSASKVEVGQAVEAGDVIGLVGATGRVTAPHLHWAARIGDARVDALDLVRVTSEGGAGRPGRTGAMSR